MPLISVCVEPDTTCLSLVDALAAAEAGAVLELSSGDYTVEDLIIDRNLTLRAAPDATVSLYAPIGDALTATAGAEVTVEGVSIAADEPFGTAIVAEDGASLTLRHVVVPPRSADYGATAVLVTGASALEAKDLTIVGHAITGTSDADGIVIIEAESTATFTGGLVQGNVCGHVGVIWARSGASVSIYEGTFTDNTALVGAAVFAREATLTVNGSVFTGNVATATELGGGAIAAYDPLRVAIESSEFSLNRGTQGGALLLTSYTADFSVTDSTFTANKAGSRGGAIASRGAATFLVADSTFTGNQSEAYGGAIDLDSTNGVAIRASGFCANRATTEGGAIAAYASNAPVGAAMIHHDWFVENSSGYQVGAIRIGMGPVQLNHLALLGNAAEDLGQADPIGGAGFYSVPMYVTSSIAAWHSGTALHAGSSAEVAGNVFYANGVDVRLSDGSSAPEGNLVTDPGISAYTDAGLAGDGVASCTAADLRLRQGSDAIGAGLGLNPDGSPADAGPFGGPDAPAWAWKDADQDGVPWAHDCDDQEPGDHQFPCVIGDWAPPDTGVPDPTDTAPSDTDPLPEANVWLTGGGCSHAPGTALLGILTAAISRRRPSRPSTRRSPRL